ncbi:MAG: hypothetical protein PHH61_06275 [Candidatus Nanoarchaeia archaeon]|nr:hypothetical protein [Candidatus Nanoarchaeia archaeon]
MFDYDGSVFEGDKTYKVIGQRILVDDCEVLKSWFNCTTVEEIKYIGRKLKVKFKTGYLEIDNVDLVEEKAEIEEHELMKYCTTFNPFCPGKEKNND